MEFTPVWLPMSLSVQLWLEFVRTTMEFTPMGFTPVWLPMSLSVQLWSFRTTACVATDEFVRTTMEFTPVWLPMSLSVQLWSLRLCGYR